MRLRCHLISINYLGLKKVKMPNEQEVFFEAMEILLKHLSLYNYKDYL